MKGRGTAALMGVAAVGIGLVAGCHAPAAPTTPTVARVTAGDPEQIDCLWQAGDKALRRYNLQPDRQDRTEGIIVTRPETSAAWFEFWRAQPEPAYAWWESNINTIRRQATLTIQPVAGPEYEVTVQVDRYRYSLSERQIDNPAAALRLFGGLAPGIESGRLETQAESGRWLPLGRDACMEQAILSNILKRYGCGEVVAPSEPAATQPTASAG